MTEFLCETCGNVYDTADEAARCCQLCPDCYGSGMVSVCYGGDPDREADVACESCHGVGRRLLKPGEEAPVEAIAYEPTARPKRLTWAEKMELAADAGYDTPDDYYGRK